MNRVDWVRGLQEGMVINFWAQFSEDAQRILTRAQTCKWVSLESFFSLGALVPEREKK